MSLLFSSLIFLLLTSFLFSLIITKILVKIMTYLKIVDKPEKRRVHNITTPRGGGLALVLIYCILLPIFEYYWTGYFNYSSDIIQLLIPIALISFLDDIIGVNNSFRLFIHSLSSFLAILWLIHPERILSIDLPIIKNIPMLADLIIGTFALMTFLNIYNFMDGIDGITAMQSIHFSVFMILLCFLQSNNINNVGFIITTSILILGWGVGFLFYNWHPA